MTAPPHASNRRSGSATSLVLSIVGLYLRRVGGWISTADLVALAAEAGVSGPLARTSIARLKKRGILAPKAADRSAGYCLPAAAEDILSRGDRRIFSVRHMSADSKWCVISFSIPESKRAVRGQLRRQLTWIGAGLLSSGLWIVPDFLRDEVEEILVGLDARQYAVLLRTEQPIVDGPIKDAIATWWDLERLACLHEEFAATCRQILAQPADDDAAAFRGYVTGIDSWRAIPYLDPGLDYDLLPADWPGRETETLFTELSTRLADASWAFVAATVTSAEATASTAPAAPAASAV